MPTGSFGTSYASGRKLSIDSLSHGERHDVRRDARGERVARSDALLFDVAWAEAQESSFFSVNST